MLIKNTGGIKDTETLKDMYPEEWNKFYNEYNNNHTPNTKQAIIYADLQIVLKHRELASENNKEYPNKSVYKFLNNYVKPTKLLP